MREGGGGLVGADGEGLATSLVCICTGLNFLLQTSGKISTN